jgi:hypothetical protein
MLSLVAIPAAAAQSRLWRPEDRTLVTDLWGLTAVAATRTVVYAATRTALAVYDRDFGTLRETVGPLEGFPEGGIGAMAASPVDDVAWLGGNFRWASYDPFTRRVDVGELPGIAEDVALDARDPTAGAYFRTRQGWYFVPRGALAARRAAPPPGRIGPLSALELQRRVPAFDAVRGRIERDDLMRGWRISAAAEAPLTGELYVATDGNGLFRLDPRGLHAERLPAALMGGAAGAIASWRGQVCAGSSSRLQVARRGITCFDESLRDFDYTEALRGTLPIPGLLTRRVLVTERAVWAATDAGLLRLRRGRGDVSLIRADGGLPSDDVRALAAGDGGVWAGTSAGLAFVSDTGGSPAVVRVVSDSPVLALVMVDDTLWAGTASGLVILPPLADRTLAVTALPQLREPVVALAARGDSIVAVTSGRLLVGSAGRWQVHDPAGASIGRYAAAVCDEHHGGFWLAGALGMAWYDPTRSLWVALTAPGDVPLPVRDVAVTRGFVWVATDIGIVRYSRRALGVDGR